MEKSKTVDLTFLRSFTKGDKAKMDKYINMFLTYAPAQLNSIQINFDRKNWNDLKIAAHSLKPQIQYMGIVGLEEIILNIENNAANRQGLDKLPELIGQLTSTCELAIEELRQELSVNNHS